MVHSRPRALVAVADGRKAFLFDDTGTTLQPRLHLKKSMEAQDNPPTHAQGTDRPGRSFQSVGHQRSAMEQTDWHERAEFQFAKDVVEAIKALHQKEPLPGLMIVAPPRTLSYLRQELSPALKKLVISEIDKDLTKFTPQEIERHIAPS